jgi:hypothetical protein
VRRVLARVAISVAAAACEVGDGSGAARGPLTILNCRIDGSDYPGEDDPPEYDLNPQFFAAEPLQDIGRARIKMNRLIIRMQDTGRQRELTDVLRFDIPSSYEVARCVRGLRAPDGTAEFDEKNCSWATGVPRLRVGLHGLVQAYFTPRATCPPSKYVPRNVVATAVSNPQAAPDAWESWIELKVFGAARAEASSPDEDRTTAPGFKVDFDQRLWAPAFHLTMRDDKVVKALEKGEPPPREEVSGVFDGFFDFDMERGQGAQTFP